MSTSHRTRQDSPDPQGAKADEALHSPVSAGGTSWDKREAELREYRERWSQMVLGATSAIAFTVVLAVCYALYSLAVPYMRSVTSALLLSVVLHPRSRLRSALYKDTCLRRMHDTQEAWARHGTLLGLVGRWVSLRHFASFVAMQLVFLLGLDKLQYTPRAKPETLRETSHGDDLNTTIRLPAAGEPSAAHSTTNTAKPPTPPRAAHLVSTRMGRRVLRALVVVLCAVLAHTLVGLPAYLLLHLGLFALFGLAVLVLEPTQFVRTMGRVWRAALVLFFLLGLAFSASRDLGTVRRGVRRVAKSVTAGTLGDATPMDRIATQPPSNSYTASVGAAYQMARGRLLSTVAPLLEQAGRVKKMFPFFNSDLPSDGVFSDTDAKVEEMPDTEPHESPFTSFSGLYKAFTRGSIKKNLVYGLFRGSHGHDEPKKETKSSPQPNGGDSDDIDWGEVFTQATAKGVPVIEFTFAVVGIMCANLLEFFDNIYACTLFLVLYRYLVQLDHTVLYYGIVKLLTVVHPVEGVRQARNIERDITVSFVTLLQSFWHLIWYHFCITLCVFTWLGLPLPFLSSVASVLLALFPLLPSWFTPITIALAVRLASCLRGGADIDDVPALTAVVAPLLASVVGTPFAALMDTRVWCLFAAAYVETSDDWLLCVSRGLRGADGEVLSAAGIAREPLPPVVVGTSIVLGLVAQGARGVVLGPFTVIVAKVIYDYWDVVLVGRDGATATAEETAPGETAASGQPATVSEATKSPSMQRRATVVLDSDFSSGSYTK